MTIPMVRNATVFDAVAATVTKELVEAGPFSQLRTARSVHLEINGGSTPNWALDIQGRVDESATWHNIDYFRTDQGAAVAPTASQLTVNWSTAQHYVIPNPPPFTRLVATRTGGTLTVYASFSSEAYSVPFPVVGIGAGTAAIGVVDTELPAAAAAGDAVANPTTTNIMAMLMGWNGATFDRWRNKVEATLLASAARTTTQTSADLSTYNMAQLRVVLDMTTVGTGSVTVSINAKDVASGKYIALLTGAAVTANSTNEYLVGLGNTVTANVSANKMLSPLIQIVVTANNANSATYSVGYQLSV